ncbi:MAG TPA: phenylalanine--tRNA ligase subunit beta [Gemmatimonadaceae bacterium]|nr:phenylalanine--tRNA ligase subunit beta [Gemmatimonadaceae bacterium]
MNASLDWLSQFAPTGRTAREVAELLTMRAATVEGVEQLRADLAQVVVGRVLEAVPHPNSDHLWLTKVDAGGGEPLAVVCGAPNVKQGAKYPFAPVGTTLPGGLTLERRKIRGEYSNGMLCSARELGLGDDHDGILELQTPAAPGTPFLEAVPAGDVRLVVDVLPNRPDLLSHEGLGRELAAAAGVALRQPPELADAAAIAAALPAPERGIAEVRAAGVTVRIDDAEGCPLYAAALIRGVAVGPSPEWLRRRIEAVGGRSISNIVDVTNYMLHGFGQPMHAFDLGRLAGPAIVVRNARAGERLVTLDGVERQLAPHMTVIADAERAQAVAGVMGGRESEVGEGTRDILLEVALFDRKRVRATRRALGLSTDASYRFERGIDPSLPERLCALAAALVVQVAGGTVEGVAIAGAAPPAPAPLALRPERAALVIGTPVTPAECAALLESVGCAVRTGEPLSVAPPSWRGDLVAEIDLVEEVARLYGYERLPDEIRAFRPSSAPDHPLVAVTRRVQTTLAGAGLFEVRPLPFVAGGDDTHVRVRNPLAENEAHLRLSLLEALARRAEHNLAHMTGDVRLFEVGTAFRPSGEARPHEELRVAALVMGRRRPPHFTEPKPPLFDEWDAKALGELIAHAARPGAEVRMVPVGVEDRLWHVEVDGERSGEVRRVPLDAPVWAAPAFGVELRLGDVEAMAAQPAGRAQVVRYRALPVTPAAEFDLALVVPDALPAERVAAVLRFHAGELLERLEVFDEFRGPGVPEGHRSLAWRVVLRHPERTLRDKEIEGRRARLVRALEEELNVRVRA